MTRNYPPIVGLNGVARAGKDTVADVLRQIYGYEIASYSDVLNQALIALNPWVDTSTYVSAEQERVHHVERYADLEEQLGYEGAKEIPEVRRLLQAMGTEVGRNLLGANIWVDAMFKNLDPGKKIAIVNVRFPNEFYAVKEQGGTVWRVERPGYTAANGHVSDTALDNFFFDAYIQNDGTLLQLADRVLEIMDGVRA